MNYILLGIFGFLLGYYGGTLLKSLKRSRARKQAQEFNIRFGIIGTTLLDYLPSMYEPWVYTEGADILYCVSLKLTTEGALALRNRLSQKDGAEFDSTFRAVVGLYAITYLSEELHLTFPDLLRLRSNIQEPGVQESQENAGSKADKDYWPTEL